MSEADREHLLGYLLGALDDEEHEQVAESLQNSPELREKLTRLKARVAPLECDRGHHQPPSGLAKRTCSWLAVQVELAVCQSNPDDGLPVRGDAGRPPSVLRLVNERRATARWHSWTLADVLVSVGIAIVAALLFFPAINHSRFQSQLLACQNKLGRLGEALHLFSQDHRGEFPQESWSGSRAYAGVFFPDLFELGYVTEPRLVLCPSAPAREGLPAWFQPTQRQIDEATGNDRRVLQLFAAGNFAYCLGYFDKGKFSGPRDFRRPTFAILSDVPCMKSGAIRTASHAGRGQNVLFEDGHVRFLPGCAPASVGDHIFVNGNGVIGAGVDRNDSVLAEGCIAPTEEIKLELQAAGPTL